MKQQALSLAAEIKDPNERLNRLREYLQAFILRSFHESEAFGPLAFVGGTALRFLYDLPRFSEDLDFSLEPSEGYRLEAWLEKLKRDLAFGDFEASVSFKQERAVHAAWVRVSRLMHEAGLSHRVEQKLSVKVEIDVRPPRGARCEDRAVNRYFLLALRHYDLPSLMAGKICALLTRGYVKGRDWYDLFWYLSKRPPVSPNLTLLGEALKQTQKSPAAEQWKDALLQKIEQVDWAEIVRDVERFLERPQECRLLTKEHFRSLLL